MCLSQPSAPPEPKPAPEPPAPPPVLEQEAPETIKKTSDTQKAKKKGTKKYRTNALAINQSSPTSGLSIPT